MRIKQASGRMGPQKVKTPEIKALVWAYMAASLIALSSQVSAQQSAALSLPDAPAPQVAAQAQKPSPPPAIGGSISGVVMDQTGAAIPGALVRLTFRSPASSIDSKTDANGGFSIPTSGSGEFVISIAAEGFASTSVPGSVSLGQVFTLPAVTLEAGSSSVIEVGMTHEEMAQEQLNVEVKQRFLGFIPNYYMSYDPHPLPLTAKQKFMLAERFTFDPVSFGLTGLTAGVQQANNDYKGFGRGAGGYGKRYAAATGTLINSTIIGGVVLPALLHQDPRYFYKGTGTIKSRTLYAIANAVICKGDNGHWQFNASSIGGGLAAGGISNFYYPKADRDGFESTFVELAIGLAENAAGNIAQEFFFRKLTSHTKQEKTPPVP